MTETPTPTPTYEIFNDFMVDGTLLKGTAPTLWCFDSVESNQIPPGAQAFAGYVDGYASFNGMRARFPHDIGLSITTHGNTGAHIADVENGAMTYQDAIQWYWNTHSKRKPCFYVQVSNQYNLELTLQRAGIPRAHYRVWSAHWTGRAHICSPACGYRMMAHPGMTQFIGNGWKGYNVDVSVGSRAWMEAVAAGR